MMTEEMIKMMTWMKMWTEMMSWVAAEWKALKMGQKRQSKIWETKKRREIGMRMAMAQLRLWVG
jgi:hypothetical protein